MTSDSTQARKRRGRRLRQNLDRMILKLYQEWTLAGGKMARARGDSEPVIISEWEQELIQLFDAEVAAGGRGSAAEWLITLVRAAAPIDADFYSQLIAAAADLGVSVPVQVHNIRTLGPGRRSPIIPNSLRVAWSFAKARRKS